MSSLSLSGKEYALEQLQTEVQAISFDSNPDNHWLLNADEETCLRFLKGNNYNVKKVFELMKKCSVWRNAYKPEKLIAKYELQPSPLPLEIRFAKAYFPMGLIGVDLEGIPVFLLQIGMIDFPRILADFGLEQLIDYGIYLQERAVAVKGQFVIIFDLGMEPGSSPIASLTEVPGWISALISFLKPYSAIVDPFYPECQKNIFFCRVPTGFYTSWNMVKYFVAERTKEKIEILASSKPEENLKRLLEVIPSFVIPKQLGGTNELRGLGKGGKLAKGDCTNESFVEHLEAGLAGEG